MASIKLQAHFHSTRARSGNTFDFCKGKYYLDLGQISFCYISDLYQIICQSVLQVPEYQLVCYVDNAFQSGSEIKSMSLKTVSVMSVCDIFRQKNEIMD